MTQYIHDIIARTAISREQSRAHGTAQSKDFGCQGGGPARSKNPARNGYSKETRITRKVISRMHSSTGLWNRRRSRDMDLSLTGSITSSQFLAQLTPVIYRGFFWTVYLLFEGMACYPRMGLFTVFRFF